MSVCTHCGRNHEATGSVCRGAPASAAPAAQKTLFGMPSVPVPPSVRTTGYAAASRAVPARLPAPAKPALPRLPTAEEARENPNLVISLEVTPPPESPAKPPARRPSPLPARGPSTPGGKPATVLGSLAKTPAPPAKPAASPGPPPKTPAPPAELLGARPISLADTPRVLTRDNPAMDGSSFGATLDLPPVGQSGLELAVEGAPTDLPPPGRGARFDLPAPPPSDEGDASAGPASASRRGLGRRLLADLKSVIELLAWAATTYLRKPAGFLVLAGVLVLPASFLQSCLATALVPRAPVVAPSPTTSHFEARRAELAKRIQEAQARGQMDSEAAVALAALTAAESTHVPVPKVEVSEQAAWLRLRLIMLIQGLLVLGLAFPVACGLLAVAHFDRDSGAAMPGLADVWPILVARGELLLAALVPAALLVALGNALFIVPGLVMGVLFLFLPHVVIFEKKGGWSALARSIDLTKGDAIRAVLAFLSFVLAAAVVVLLTRTLLPPSTSRAVAFTHFIVSDLLAVAVLPIPALVLARLYLDSRGKKTNAESLSRAARS